MVREGCRVYSVSDACSYIAYRAMNEIAEIASHWYVVHPLRQGDENRVRAAVSASTGGVRRVVRCLKDTASAPVGEAGDNLAIQCGSASLGAPRTTTSGWSEASRAHGQSTLARVCQQGSASVPPAQMKREQ